MTQTQLLPCPFCGGEAELDRTAERFEYCTGGPNSVMDFGYWVYCTKCDASMGASVPPSSPEEATREWNRRAESAELDRLRQQVTQLEQEHITLWHTINTQAEYIAALESETAEIEYVSTAIDPENTAEYDQTWVTREEWEIADHE